MKKLLFASLLLPMLAFAVAEWVSVQLDEKVSVKFPEAPSQKEAQGNNLWTLNTPTALYLGMTVDFSKFGLDSATMIESLKSKEFFDNYRDGILGQLPEGKLISESTSTYKGNTVMDYKFTMNSGMLMTYYSRNYFIGTKVYSLSYIEKEDHPKSPDRDKFFGSIGTK